MDAVRAAGLYREPYKLVEDVDLFLRLALRGRLANMPQRLLRYRMHNNSTCMTLSVVQDRLMRQLIIEAHQDRDMQPSPEVQQWLDSPPVDQEEPTFSKLQLQAYWAWRGLNNGNLSYALIQSVRGIWMEPKHPLGYQTLVSVLRRAVYWPDHPKRQRRRALQTQAGTA